MRRLLLFLALAVLPSSCGGQEAAPPAGPIEGLLTDIGRSGDRVTSLVVDGPEGEVKLMVDPKRDYGFDLSHLDEHLELEQPVRITVETRGDVLYAVRIDDA